MQPRARSWREAESDGRELGGELAIAEGSATIAGFLGYGHDTVDPTSRSGRLAGVAPACSWERSALLRSRVE
jgi:hypothetical protein